jgi:hypothetical protein
MLRKLIAVPYELSRLPLVLLDHGLSDRLPEDAAPRVTLDRALGSADKLAGALLGNPDIAERGADRIERSDKRVAAARLEQQADIRREQAREADAAGRRQAAQLRNAAQKKAASGIREADAAEAQAKQDARAKAARTASAKKAAANKRAATRTATVEKRKAQTNARVEAKKKAVQRRPKAELDDARKTKRAAAETRADADRLSDIADAKKQ